MDRFSLLFKRPCQVQIKREPIETLGETQVLVKTLFSSISAGTELLLYRNMLQKETLLDTSIPCLSHTFSYPCKYGYSTVGRVISLGTKVPPQWQDALVFSFHPHESHFTASPEDLVALPRSRDPRDALFLPNMETALNFVLDGRPQNEETVVVFGQGVVGLLLTALLAKNHRIHLATIDRYPLRRSASMHLGASTSVDCIEKVKSFFSANTSGAKDSADLCFEVSGDPAALNDAVELAGFNGRIIIGSWYGTKKVQLDLGNHFHRSRIRLQSSQVSTPDPQLSVHWPKARRIGYALRMIQMIKPAHLITHTFPFAQAAAAYSLLNSHPEEAIQVILQYEEA